MAKIRVIKTEVYSRVVGYYRPVDNWNAGKQAEFSERKLIDPKSYNITIQEEEQEKEIMSNG